MNNIKTKKKNGKQTHRLYDNSSKDEKKSSAQSNEYQSTYIRKMS